ncbi:hypothetical protein M0E87_01100 [Corynebacterium sp. CCM 9185]|uniref:Uncharacterized protein n=1 Tax=Corynebacterium marambiense TaxID=2765364 RepID=A0ABS0VRN2_9CORY|nr:hypothetical protein [Corynebacterium marambiense]MBI8999431.1 hypothetical protein [Corynebacterium marambiense]MCK7662269.1 hypothetical protein [Corynebacterium marambiense]
MATYQESTSRRVVDIVDSTTSPASVVAVKQNKWFSRYSEDSISLEQLDGIQENDGDLDTSLMEWPGNDVPSAIGQPVGPLFWKYNQTGRISDLRDGVDAMIEIDFSMKGLTKNPVVVKEILASVINESEEFSPKIMTFFTPQGDSPRVNFAIDLGSPDRNALEVENGSITGERYLSSHGSSISSSEVTSYKALVIVPSGKKVKFNIEFHFEGYDDPIVVDDHGNPFVAVGYPSFDNPPDRTFVRPDMVGHGDAFNRVGGLGLLVQCVWGVDCSMM